MAVNPDTVPTQLIHTSGPVATPVDYKVPGSQEIQLSSVSAEFDGGGASGSFDATLSIYSQDGQLLSRTKAGPTVAAGATGVATWVPFLRAPQATAAAALPVCYANKGSIAYVGVNPITPVFDTFTTNDSTVFSLDGSGHIAIASTGIYMIDADMGHLDSPPFSYGQLLTIEVDKNDGGGFNPIDSGGDHTYSFLATPLSEIKATSGTVPAGVWDHYFSVGNSGGLNVPSSATLPWALRLNFLMTGVVPGTVHDAFEMQVVRLGAELV